MVLALLDSYGPVMLVTVTIQQLEARLQEAP